MDVRDNTGGSDGDVGEELVELFVVADGEHDVAWGNAGLLVIAGSISGKFENFDGKVLEDGSHEDRSASTDAVAIAALTEETMETADRELKAGTAGAGLRMRALSVDGGLCSSLLDTLLGWHYKNDFLAVFSHSIFGGEM